MYVQDCLKESQEEDWKYTLLGLLIWYFPLHQIYLRKKWERDYAIGGRLE